MHNSSDIVFNKKDGSEYKQVNGLGFNPSGSTRNVQDLTKWTDSAKVKGVGMLDHGNISLDLIYDATDAVHTAMYNDFISGDEGDYKLVFTDMDPDTFVIFKAYVTSFPLPTLAVDEKAKVTITLEISGAVTSGKESSE